MSFTHTLSLLRTADHPLHIAITGGRHVGKTTALRQLFRLCVAEGMNAGGFVEKAIFQNDIRMGYDFVDLQTEETCPVARKLNTGGYQFYDDAWAWAENRLYIYRHTQILFVDEIGRLEAQNLGFMPSLCRALQNYSTHLIAAVRDDALELTEPLCGKWDEIIRISPAEEHTL